MIWRNKTRRLRLFPKNLEGPIENCYNFCICSLLLGYFKLINRVYQWNKKGFNGKNVILYIFKMIPLSSVAGRTIGFGTSAGCTGLPSPGEQEEGEAAATAENSASNCWLEAEIL